MYYGLYVVYEFSVRNIDLSSGIAKKIFSQKECLEKLPAEINFYNPYEEKMGNKIFSFCRRLPFFGFFYSINLDEDNIKKLDFVYIRKPWFIDFDTLNFLKNIKMINKKVKIIMEIPTFPYDYEIESYSLWPLLVKDKIVRHFLHNYVDRIVTYSNDKVIWGIDTIQISNGVQITEELLLTDAITYNGDDTLNIIAVSNLAFWHGYDRAVVGLYKYYKSGGKKNIKLHVVGEGRQLKKLKEMVSKFELQNNVIFYGKQNKQQLKKIYECCLIGLDSLGRHRSKVYYNSSLKSKEYLMKGLLVVSGVSNELDLYGKYKYYLRVPADESPIDFNDIISFYEISCKGKKINEIRNEIIEFAKKFFLMDVVMNPVRDYIISSCSISEF